MNNALFTRKVPSQAKLLCLLTVVPLYLVGSSLIGNAFMKFVIITFSLNLSYNTINAYLNLVVDLCMALYVVWIFKDSLKKQWYDFIKDIKTNMLFGCVIGVAMIYGVSILGGIITILLGGAADSENQTLINTITIAHPFIMMFTTVVLAPILEETIFRGMIFGWLYEIHPKVAHFVSAFLFGFIHIMMSVLNGNMAEWLQIFSYFFMGFVLSYLYEKRNNIYVPMLTHAMNNFISMLLIMFAM